MNFFTSDIHFSDETSLKTGDRPFKNIHAYNRAIVRNFNHMLHKGDTLYVVGDLLDCDGPEYLTWQDGIKWTNKLHADVVLIMGNNEDRIVKYFFNDDFEAFRQYLMERGFKDVHKNYHMTIDGKEFYLVHRPSDYQEGYINLFGHCHRCKGLWQTYGLNVSVDLNFFRPWKQERLLDELARRDRYINEPEFKVH